MPVFLQLPRRLARPLGVLLVGLCLLTSSACRGPYRHARTVGSVGGVLAAVGGATWVIGETRDAPTLIVPGVIAMILGSAGLLTSAMMIAGQSSCVVDADCPLNHVCKELLQPAGRESFSQCVPR